MITAAKTPTKAEAEKMAIAFLESRVYEDTQLDRDLLRLIRDGCAIFKEPDLFQITEKGKEVVQDYD